MQENIAVGLKNQGMSTKEALEKVDYWLETIGLPTSGEKYPNQLSGGQQQRVALARALALSPVYCYLMSRCQRWCKVRSLT